MFYSSFMVLIFCSSALGNTVHQRIIRHNAENNSCTTPDNQPGKCTNIKQCSYLHDILKLDGAMQPETKSFLKKSSCGKDRDNAPKVCCNPEAKTPFVTPSLRFSSTLATLTPTSQKANTSRIPIIKTQTTKTLSILFSSTQITSTSSTPASISQPINNDRYEDDEEQVIEDFSICGRSNRNAIKIVGGHNSTLGDWPWIVALGYRRYPDGIPEWLCAGSIISKKWIVTAAHCVKNIRDWNLTTVRIGDLNLDDAVDDGAMRWNIPVEEIIAHPEFSSNPLENDIALIRLRNQITFTKNIRPICILNKDEHKKDKFYANKAPFIAGWGRTKEDIWSNMLQETQVYIVNLEDCSKAYKSEKSSTVPIDARVLCASRTGKDSCQGDSGGPLMMPVKASYYLIGIVSYGIGCANDVYPGVYTKVAYFSDWIQTIAEINW